MSGRSVVDFILKLIGIHGFVYSDDEVIKTIESPIRNSILQLVFEEPVGVDRIYAEEHGDFHSIKKVGEHAYIKTAPNGRESSYYYENGTLQKSDVNAGIIKFSIIILLDFCCFLSIA